ncbi:hypothetical protein PsYK624_062420 [Phanerochaete sordida]|uniref:Uncharacterized protein n=1 Tax=Phanerochaete sordida TaxID=48140 RepID=A0A9P3G959_9APHY|nr:hypothetical protein PsYK624_062420 [Phanerochaete sordida]
MNVVITRAQALLIDNGDPDVLSVDHLRRKSMDSTRVNGAARHPPGNVRHIARTVFVLPTRAPLRAVASVCQ